MPPARPSTSIVAEELQQSHAYGGRSVFGWEPAPAGQRRADD